MKRGFLSQGPKSSLLGSGSSAERCCCLKLAGSARCVGDGFSCAVALHATTLVALRASDQF